MATTSHRRIAIVSPGDRTLRETATGDEGRFVDLFAALRAAGHQVEPAIYDDDFADEVHDQLIAVDVALVWRNPIHEGRTRAVLDRMLATVARSGTFVSAHPDVILKLGTKEVLYDTRELGWGVDTNCYRSSNELLVGLCSALPDGARVLKQHRGSSGDGVWRCELATPDLSPVNDATPVRVRHAKRGSADQVLPLGELCMASAHYFADDGLMIDQQFQRRLSEGMIRCYLVGNQVAGFGVQEVNALIQAPPGGEAPLPSERLYHPPTLPEGQALKRKLEREWIPGLQRLLDIPDYRLPLLWDCDFLLGEPDPSGADTYVLCEINASSVAPYPPSAVPAIVEAVGQLP